MLGVEVVVIMVAAAGMVIERGVEVVTGWVLGMGVGHALETMVEHV